MSNNPTTERPTMRRPAPDDTVTFRLMLPANLVSKTEAGLTVRTCRGSVIVVPRSVLAPTSKAAEAGDAGAAPGIVIQGRTKRDIADLLASLVTEIARLTRELNESRSAA